VGYGPDGAEHSAGQEGRREEGEKEKDEGGRGKDGERGEKEQAGRRRGAPAWDNLISQNLSLRWSEVGHAGAQKCHSEAWDAAVCTESGWH